MILLQLILASTTLTFADLIDDLRVPARPMQLGISLSQNSTSENINAAKGGSVTLQTSRATYTFTVAPGSIDEDTNFTLTEITSLGGESQLPSDKTFAVKILPEGLEFTKPAELVIKPNANLSASEITPFSFEKNGEDLHLEYFTTASDQISIKLHHLSGYGLGESITFRERVLQFFTENKSHRLQNAIIKDFTEFKNSGQPIPKDYLLEQSHKYFIEVIKPKLDHIESCKGAQHVISENLGILRQLALLDEGYSLPEYLKQHQNYIDVATSKQLFECNKEYGSACVNENKFSEFVQYSLGMHRQFALLGFDPAGVNGYEDYKKWEKRCFRFEVHFFNSFEFIDMPGPMMVVDLKFPYDYKLFDESKVSIPYEVKVPKFSSGQGITCSLKEAITSPGTFDLDLIDFIRVRTIYPESPRLGFWFDPGLPQVIAIGACHDDSDPPNHFDLPMPMYSDPSMSLYTGTYTAVHMHEINSEFNLFRVKDFLINFHSDVVLKKSFTKFHPELMQEEVFKLQVRHDPIR